MGLGKGCGYDERREGVSAVKMRMREWGFGTRLSFTMRDDDGLKRCLLRLRITFLS